MSEDERSPAPHGPVRHGAGFLASGLIAFSVDAAVLWVMTQLARADPFSGRLAAIAIAMVAGWLAHRRLTFNLKTPPSLGEFGRYAALGWSAAALNYAVYVAVLVVRPDMAPVLALVIATAVAMGFSYIGMRFGVFRTRG